MPVRTSLPHPPVRPSPRDRLRCVPGWVVLTVALTGGGPPVLAAQDAEPVRRPRVGLVLGGGGARGGAHIGVLRALEEQRIPVDLIAGTSMGAIVGGAYASGMQVDEIEDLLASMDWGDLFRGGPRRQDLTFRRKQDSRVFSMDVEIGFDGDRFGLPASLVGGHSLNLLLKEITLPVSDVRDFDDLPIPFRAVAADIAAGEMVVLGRGDLSRAIQASMAVPGAFEPVGIGGRLLVDGGTVRNLPVDVVREMGADVVVAVDVGSPLEEMEALRDALGVLRQTTQLLVYENSRRSRETLEEGDVLIVPDLGTMSAGDFGEVMSTVEAGYEAAVAAAPSLSSMSLSPREYAPYRARTLPRETSIQVDFVEIVNQTALSDAVIRSLLDVPEGVEVELDALLDRLTVLQGAGDFQRVDFRVDHRAGETGLVVIPVDKRWGPGFFRFGVAIKDDIETLSTFDLLARFTLTRVNRKGAELRGEVQIGQTRRMLAELYQPLDNHLRLFGEVAGEFRSEVVPIFEGETQVARFRVRRAGVGLSLGSRLGLWGQGRAGVVRQEVRTEPLVGAVDLPEVRSGQASVFAEVVIDDLDDPWFPEDGVFGSLRVARAGELLGAGVSFDRAEARMTGALTMGANTWLLTAAAGSSLGSALPLWERFTLGGFTRMSGLLEDELAGNYYGFGSLTYLRRISPPRGLSPVGGFRFGASLEAGNAWDTTDAVALESLRLSGSAFVGFETLIGPVYLAYGQADGGRNSYYFLLGPAF